MSFTQSLPLRLAAVTFLFSPASFLWITMVNEMDLSIALAGLLQMILLHGFSFGAVLRVITEV